MNNFILITCISILIFSQISLADDKVEMAWSIYFEGYYSYNFNKPQPITPISGSSGASAANPAPNNTYRYYDSYHNELSLGLTELSFKAAKDDISFLTDLDFGSFADLNASQSSSSGTVVDEVTKHIGQAVASYKPKDSRWSFDLGKMYTHVGLETAKSKDNWQFSRSSLFTYGIPFWHTGLRVGYEAVSSKLFTSLYIYNGWNSIHDNNSAKTIGAQLKWQINDKDVLIYNFLGGPEQANDGSNWKATHNLNYLAQLSTSWQIGVDLLTGNEDSATVGSNRVRAKWHAASLAFKNQLSEKTYFSPRYDIYRDEDGNTLGGAPQTVQSGTLTVGHQLSKAFEVRTEVRADSSDLPSFRSGSGFEKNQTTVLVSALVQI